MNTYILLVHVNYNDYPGIPWMFLCFVLFDPAHFSECKESPGRLPWASDVCKQVGEVRQVKFFGGNTNYRRTVINPAN